MTPYINNNLIRNVRMYVSGVASYLHNIMDSNGNIGTFLQYHPFRAKYSRLS